MARNLARARMRQGRRDDSLEIAAKIARRDFHHAINKRKKEHWTEFLGESTISGKQLNILIQARDLALAGSHP
jgi:hypothetical protein